MPANVQPLFELTAQVSGFQFVNATGTTKETVFTAGANGSRIDSISICSSDTSARDVAISIYDGTNYHYIGNAHVPIGAGYTTVAKVEGLTSVMPTGVPFIFLPSGYTLVANMVVAVTTALAVDVHCLGGAY